MQIEDKGQDLIQVLIRVKPDTEDQTLIYTEKEISIDKYRFAFDRIFGSNSKQEDIFEAVGRKIIDHTFQGYNSCVFAYGQTGSGKTYTMMGNGNGLMQRSFNQLFQKIDKLEDKQCVVTCSYYQLYNQQIIDLLDASKEKKSLNIRQDVNRGVYVQNLTEQNAFSTQKLMDCLNSGMKNRHIGQTMMNRQSSRSHSVFTLALSINQEIRGKKILKTPKLHFVDLAGSERQKMTMASGQRLKQAGNINKSLTTLGMVINSLASDKPKAHIPYRDSKLTFLLKDSLGGNSKTFIIATVSPATVCFNESLSTLNFANRAKMVKVRAVVNQQKQSRLIEIQKLEERIRLLEQQLMAQASSWKYEKQCFLSEIQLQKNQVQVLKTIVGQRQYKIAELQDKNQTKDSDAHQFKNQAQAQFLLLNQQKQRICAQLQQHEIQIDLLKSSLQDKQIRIAELQKLDQKARIFEAHMNAQIQSWSRQKQKFQAQIEQRGNHMEQLQTSLQEKKNRIYKLQKLDQKAKIFQARITDQVYSLNNQKEELNSKLEQHEAHLQTLKSSLQNKETRIAELQQLDQKAKTFEAHIMIQVQSWNREKQSFYNQLQQRADHMQALKNSLQEKENRIAELQKLGLKNRSAVNQYSQLKQSYKDVIKQNYKLKGQYYNSSNQNICQSAKNQQLVSKVAFYQEKFRLMSIQYNKVQQNIKKLKNKQLSLMKKVEFYQQSQKLKKIHRVNDQSQEIIEQRMKALHLQNKQLKESISKTKQMYQSLVSNDKKEDYSKRMSLQNQKYELQQKQQKIRNHLEASIRSWNLSKENRCEGLPLQELFECWEKIQGQSRKKIQGITNGIKRQQKLKSQNKFILKENFYLKQKIQVLQKNLQKQEGGPRKMVKLDQEKPNK